ncbi:hypothetical protein, partial [uncultured Rhodoblastus sp.]|uniref:hypothetical protein n=1 Tax=uncultured Rhodoblastus sp. TaxID=543037 RepID=UPI0025D8E463
MSARLRTMKSKRERALCVRDETVADPIGKVSKEPIPADGHRPLGGRRTTPSTTCSGTLAQRSGAVNRPIPVFAGR